MMLQLKGKWLLPYFPGDDLEYDPVERSDWRLAPLICPRAHSEGVIQKLSEPFLCEYARFLLLNARG